MNVVFFNKMVVFHGRIGENCKYFASCSYSLKLYLLKRIIDLMQSSKGCLQFTLHSLTVENSK